MKLVHGRLAGVSVRASFAAGLWVGAMLGLFIGTRPRWDWPGQSAPHHQQHQ